MDAIPMLITKAGRFRSSIEQVAAVAAGRFSYSFAALILEPMTE